MTAEHDTIALAREVCGLLGDIDESGLMSLPTGQMFWLSHALREGIGPWPPFVGILAEEMRRRGLDVSVGYEAGAPQVSLWHSGPVVVVYKYVHPNILDAMCLACIDALRAEAE